MHHLRPTTYSLACALLLGATQAHALGFGPAPGGATLGQPLDFVVPLRLEGSEGAPPDCVSAEVLVGDQRLAPGSVRARVEGSGPGLAVRVQTASSIDEPVVAVTVALGCPARLQRRFTLFADPPSGPSVLPPSAVVDVTPPAPAAAVPNDSRASVAEPRQAAPAAPPVAAATPPRPRTPKPPARATARRAAPPAAAAAPRARLKLDAVDPPAAPNPTPAPVAAEVIEAAASAAAAKAAAAAASAAAERIAALEKAIEKMRSDSAADRDALRQLRARAADNDAAASWLPYLAALVATLAGISVWQWLKLRRLMREKQQAWWSAAAAAPPTDEAAVASAPSSAPTPLAPLSGGSYPTTRPGALGTVFRPEPEPVPEPAAEPPVTAMERTQPLPVGWREEPEAPRDVSIEELIDLEQQAEFFLVLGQEDAAIDLLVDHLRSTGGGSPMPYLKLLEIYRKRGDRESYDRMRARFNHRFNAYAPDWDADPHAGRSLEDYPAIIARLQMAWPSPLDAMAELEALLFRKSKGELFDMPAYRDVLFLYSLARDLLDREPVETGNVDVLLPISDGETYTQPMSLEQIYDGVDSGSVPLDNAPTVPVDLDVTQPVIPDSLFSDPTEPGIGSSGRRRH